MPLSDSTNSKRVFPTSHRACSLPASAPSKPMTLSAARFIPSYHQRSNIRSPKSAHRSFRTFKPSPYGQLITSTTSLSTGQSTIRKNDDHLESLARPFTTATRWRAKDWSAAHQIIAIRISAERQTLSWDDAMQKQCSMLYRRIRITTNKLQGVIFQISTPDAKC